MPLLVVRQLLLIVLQKLYSKKAFWYHLQKVHILRASHIPLPLKWQKSKILCSLFYHSESTCTYLYIGKSKSRISAKYGQKTSWLRQKTMQILENLITHFKQVVCFSYLIFIPLKTLLSDKQLSWKPWKSDKFKTSRINPKSLQ